MEEYTVEDVESAFIDIVDGNDRHDIKGMTGLSDERCEEIENLFNAVFKSYRKRHGLR